MKTKFIYILFLISTIWLLTYPIAQAQQTIGNSHQFDFLRIGNPALQTLKTTTKKPNLESLNIESWMLSTDDWNAEKPVVCIKAKEISKVDTLKNKLHDLGITQEKLLVFAVAVVAMIFS